MINGNVFTSRVGNFITWVHQFIFWNATICLITCRCYGKA
ncbi:hypothetical protein MGSAQ_002992 [marine sediment metagenome]|uniref:Uncharacterized protein n=1 Tax=marine sediment metagenome TaxID=412755 RepID=A0A1B6NQ28_9ZZZZ